MSMQQQQQLEKKTAINQPRSGYDVRLAIYGNGRALDFQLYTYIVHTHTDLTHTIHNFLLRCAKQFTASKCDRARVKHWRRHKVFLITICVEFHTRRGAPQPEIETYKFDCVGCVDLHSLAVVYRGII